MTESISFSSASEVNPPASAAESISVNSHNELSTGSDAVVNPEATNRGVDNSGTGGGAWLPDVTGMTRTGAAQAYMQAGVFVFPVDGKLPAKLMGGRMKWATESTTDPEQHARWSKAIWAPSGEHLTHRRGMAVDLGKTSAVVVDVDRPELVPDEWWAVLDQAPFVSTDTEDPRRGHYYFAQPPGLIGCPKGEWGEIKGVGGYVILPPSPHACAHLDWPDGQTPEGKYRPTARYLQVRTGVMPVLPELIADTFGEHRQAQACASAEDVRAFMETYQGGEGEDPALLGGIVDYFVKASTGARPKGRHPVMVGCCAWAAKAARGGLISAEMAKDALHGAFRHVLSLGEDARTEMPGEFDGMWEWGVGQATPEQTAEFLMKRKAKTDAYFKEKYAGAPDEPAFAGLLDADGHVIDGRETMALVRTAADEVPNSPESLTTPPDPIPLDEEYPEAYDTYRFGHLGKFVRAVGEAVEVPTDMPLMAALGTISTAVGGRRSVRIRHGYTESVTHYGITNAPPGSKKGVSQDICRIPLDKEVSRRAGEAQHDVMKDASARNVAAERLRNAEKAAAKPGSRDDILSRAADLDAAHEALLELGDPKDIPRLFVDDATPETLPGIMKPQGERIAVITSESSFLSNIAGRYSNGNPNVDLVLKAYGHEEYIPDRVGDKRPKLDSPSITISLAIQDGVISQLGKAATMMDEKGMWGRVMWAVPQKTAGTRRFNTPEIPSALQDEYNQRITALMEECYDSEDIVEMTLSEGASQLAEEFYETTDPKIFSDAKRVRFIGWDDKQFGRLMRTAALITLYNDPTAKEIPADIMRDILALDATMASHARKASSFMNLSGDDPLVGARDVLEWVLRTEPSGRVRRRDVHNALGRKKWLVRRDDLDTALEILAERYWIAFPRGDDGRLDHSVFVVHPSIAGEEEAAPGVPQERVSGVSTPGVIPVAEAVGVVADPDPEPEKTMELLALEVGRFVREKCVTGPARTHKLAKDVLHQAFCGWAERDVDKQLFTRALKTVAPVETKRLGKERVYSYVGILYRG